MINVGMQKADIYVLSTDTKPTGESEGKKFKTGKVLLELDTAVYYCFYEPTETWYPQNDTPL